VAAIGPFVRDFLRRPGAGNLLGDEAIAIDRGDHTSHGGPGAGRRATIVDDDAETAQVAGAGTAGRRRTAIHMLMTVAPTAIQPARS
jgi:hypothetical protein